MVMHITTLVFSPPPPPQLGRPLCIFVSIVNVTIPRKCKEEVFLIISDGGHIGRHIWMWVIVPSDLTQSFSGNCTHYHDKVIHHRINILPILHAICIFMKGNSRMLDRLSYEKIRRYNNSLPHVMVRWPPKQIPPLNFLEIFWLVMYDLVKSFLIQFCIILYPKWYI